MKKSLLLLLAPLLLPGCALPTPEFPVDLPKPSAQQNQTQPQDWLSVKPGLAAKKLITSYEDHTYTALVFRLDNKLTQWNLAHDTEPKRLTQWAQDLGSDVVLNGAFFTEDFHPTGLFKNDGKTINDKTYTDMSVGTINIADGRLTLVKNGNKATGQDIFQSFPLLIRPDKNEAISEDSEKIARRTIIAQDGVDFTYVIIFDTTPLSLYTASIILPRLLPELVWALNLDGGPSTGLYVANGDDSVSILPAAMLPIVLSATLSD